MLQAGNLDGDKGTAFRLASAGGTNSRHKKKKKRQKNYFS
jgi:hypothetical protein